MTAKLILNPYANRWNAGKRQLLAEQALHNAGIEYEMVCTQRPGHMAELAEQAARQGFSPIIIAGGDGSLGEAINGLARTVSDGEPLPVLGILPMGTANDLAYALKIPFDLNQAARIIATGHVRPMDLGQANDLYFINNSALGLEPYISVIQARIGWIKGMARYLVAAILGILDRPAWYGRIEWDGGSFDGPLSLVYVGNGPRSGGVFYMAPHADPFDGKLTLVYGYRSSRRAMLALLPKTMKPMQGSYVESPGIREIHVSWLKIHLENPTPAHTDGEVFTNGIQDIEYRIQPGRIRILLP